jgi:hypothetical protein
MTGGLLHRSSGTHLSGLPTNQELAIFGNDLPRSSSVRIFARLHAKYFPGSIDSL